MAQSSRIPGDFIERQKLPVILWHGVQPPDAHHRYQSPRTIAENGPLPVS